MAGQACDLQALAVATGTPWGTLRSWASRKGWQPVGKRGGRKVYEIEMVLAEIERRRLLSDAAPTAQRFGDGADPERGAS